MAREHFIVPTAPVPTADAVRLGAGNAEVNRYDYKEAGKIVKLVGESRYDLAVAGDQIEGVVQSIELAPQNGYSIGSVVKDGRMYAIADGLQATPGVGVIALGDYVVTGTVVAKGTALTSYPKVCAATALVVGTTPPVNFPAGSNLNHKWRVVSLGAAGTGAVGTTIVIERVQ